MAENIQATHYTCSNCGGNLKWNIQKQAFECESCHSPGEIDLSGAPVVQHPIEDFERLSSQSPAFPGESVAICQNCGATITFNGNTTATVCPMCGSPQIDAARQVNGVAPDGIIPFKVDKADAKAAFAKWVGKRWFAPNALKKSYQEGKLEGVYLPYFTYDSDSEAFYSGQGGKIRHHKDKDGNDYTTTDWYPVTGHVSASFNDIPICDASPTAKSVANGVQPYSTENGAVSYNPAYLSGMNAEHYATGAVDSFREADQQIESRLRSDAHSDILCRGYDSATVTTLKVSHHNVEYKHLLLPAWLSAFAFGGKTYTYMINGETGKVSGKRPYSVPKIVAAVLVVIAILAAVFMFKNRPAKDQPQQAYDYVNYSSASVMNVSEDDVLAARYDGAIPQYLSAA